MNSKLLILFTASGLLSLASIFWLSKFNRKDAKAQRIICYFIFASFAIASFEDTNHFDDDEFMLKNADGTSAVPNAGETPALPKNL